MDDGLRTKLEIDSAQGDVYSRAWENIIEPFFNRKSEELYQAFKSMPTTETDNLVALKMQVNALESLKDEMMHNINTGKLAKAALKEEDENE